MRTILDIVNDEKNEYKTGTIEIAEDLKFSQYKTIREIQFMTNSKYLSGDKDKYGREKPYFNIVNANVWVSVVATDIDRKDINFSSDNPDDYAKSFVIRRLADNWMREADFGTFQNRAGETRARYGGVLVKKCEEIEGKEKKLYMQAVEWNNTASVDPSAILDGIIIEKYNMAPDKVAEKKDVWDNTDEAIKLFTTKKGRNDKVDIYDIHGPLPSFLMVDDPEESETYEFTRQHHIIAVKGAKHVELFKEDEKKSPYKYRAWEYVEGRDLGRGVVEKGMWAQIEANDAIIGEKEAFELGRKVLFKTSSKKVGNNAITDLDNGHIIQLEDGKDINILNTISNNLPEFQNLIDKWKVQFDRAGSITDALRGETPPSGQSYHLGALTTQQAGSSFDYIREDMGLFYEEIFRDWVLPYLIKRYKKKQIISSDLFSAEELVMLDEKYATANANKAVKKMFLSGKSVTQQEYEAIKQQYKNHIATTGGRRFIETEDDFLKGYEGRAIINTTNEQVNKMAILESLSGIITAVSQSFNPQTRTYALLENPALRQIFNRIVEISDAGISPIQLGTSTQPQQTQPTQQAGPQQAIKPALQPSPLNLPGPAAVTGNG